MFAAVPVRLGLCEKQQLLIHQPASASHYTETQLLLGMKIKASGRYFFMNAALGKGAETEEVAVKS